MTAFIQELISERRLHGVLIKALEYNNLDVASVRTPKGYVLALY